MTIAQEIEAVEWAKDHAQDFGKRAHMRQAEIDRMRERLEAACGRALTIGARSYTSVNSILKNNLDRRRPAKAADGPAILHSNIRGPGYFH